MHCTNAIRMLLTLVPPLFIEMDVRFNLRVMELITHSVTRPECCESVMNVKRQRTLTMNALQL